jgi:hypothetical protein
METKLKMTADASEAKKAGQVVKEAFSPRGVQEFNTATKDLEKQFVSLTKKQTDLTKKLLEVEKGAKAYSGLKQELKLVKEQADLVSQSLTQLDRAQKRAQVTQQQSVTLQQRERKEQAQASEQQRNERRRERTERRQGFVAGVGQGLGVSEYIPTGVGMVPRMAGSVLGRTIRRAAGGAAAPFLAPGMGGLTRMMQSIPLVGGYAAGAAQTAASALESAVGFERARAQNLYFTGPQMGRQQPDYINPRWERARQEEQVTAAEVVRIAGERSQLKQKGMFLAGSQTRVGRDALYASARRGNKGAQAAIQELNLQSRIQKQAVSGAVGAFAIAGGLGVRLDPVTGAIRSTRKQLGETAEEQVAAQQRRDEAAARMRGLKEMLPGGRASGLGGIGLGTEFGIAPTQTTALKGQFFGRRGGLYGVGGSARQFQESLAAYRAYGISPEQAGGLARMGMPGGGGTGGGDLARVLQSAEVMDLRGSQVVEYLQQLVSLGQGAEQRGVKINVSEFVKQTMTLRQAGFQGQRIARVAGGLQGAAMDLSQRGVQSPMDMLLLRAAGFDPAGGPESLARAKNRLASEGMRAEILKNLITDVTKGARQGGGPEMKKYLVRMAFGELQTPITPREAGKLLEGGKLDISRLMARTEEAGGREGLLERARFKVGVGAPLTREAARMDVARINIGKASTWVFRFGQNTLEASKLMQNFSTDLGRLSTAVNAAIKTFNEVTEGGAGGILKAIKSLVE